MNKIQTHPKIAHKKVDHNLNHDKSNFVEQDKSHIVNCAAIITLRAPHRGEGGEGIYLAAFVGDWITWAEPIGRIEPTPYGARET